MPSIDFSELTDEQAQAAFEAYVAAADDRLAWLRNEVAASGGRTSSTSVQRASFRCGSWARDALVAQFLLATDGDGRLLAIEGGVVTEDAPRELRAREFRELLEVLQKAARELDARLYDHQLGRFLVGDHDFEAAVAGFA